jgi:glycosyltransferase involved in cell wall biosynthesis
MSVGENSPVIVAGMHRSGTSLVASILSKVFGVHVGESLLAADRNNQRGYFEDTDVVELNRTLLLEATRADDGGHRDWGWTESEQFDESVFARHVEPARELIAARTRLGVRWGWKGPRTTLLLDFWDALLDDARYVLLYRFPWEVADSVQRLGAEVFLQHPEYGYRIWHFYNRRMLDFYRRHRDRAILVSTDAFLNDPDALSALLTQRLGLQAGDTTIDQLLDPELIQHFEKNDPLIPLAALTHPESAALLSELDAAADLSGAGLWHAHTRVASNSSTPRVGIVIPCFNQGELLVEAVASVERSVPEPYELIIVNDGSTEPRTLQILDALRSAGYRVIDQENQGLAAARNRGISEMRAPYILPLDADNRLRSGFVEPALEILDREPKIGVVYGDRHDFGMREGTVDVPPFSADRLLPFNYIDACALLRKEVWSACGGYDGAMPSPGWEDWDLWLGAIERGWEFHHHPVEAFDYRIAPQSMSAAIRESEETRRDLYAYVINKHRDLYQRRLPEVLLASQASARDLFNLARAHELLGAAHASLEASQPALHRLIADQNGVIEAHAAQISALNTRIDEMSEQISDMYDYLDETQREATAAMQSAQRVIDEKDSQLHEHAARIADLSRHIQFMEGTRVWRWREKIVRLKHALGKWRQ